jgi:hypothetical protein
MKPLPVGCNVLTPTWGERPMSSLSAVKRSVAGRLPSPRKSLPGNELSVPLVAPERTSVPPAWAIGRAMVAAISDANRMMNCILCRASVSKRVYKDERLELDSK